MKKFISLFFFLIISYSAIGDTFKVNAPGFVIINDSADIIITLNENVKSFPVELELKHSGKSEILELKSQETRISIPIKKTSHINFSIDEKIKGLTIRKVPAWLSILPPLIAIIMALIFKEVYVSLFTGIFFGSLIIHGLSFDGIIASLMAAIGKYAIVALSDSGNMSVIIFSMTIGGMVTLISRNGGMHGIVDKLMPYAHSARSSQLVTWFLGLAIFFDDYANTLIVGNTMRSVTDKFKVSREKLAYIVDSTAAPIAALAFITTWIGAELGYISKANESLGIDEGAYSMFLNSLEYAYYPVFTIIFMFILLYSQKDFGPMHRAENDSRNSSATESTGIKGNYVNNDLFNPVDQDKARWYNGFVPVITVISVTIASLIITGLASLKTELLLIDSFNSSASTWSQIGLLAESNENLSSFRKLGMIIGASDSYLSLLWASFSGVFVALIMTLSQRIMSLNESIEVLIEGFKSLVPAMLILILAWSLTEITLELKTADFMTLILKDNVNPNLMPLLTFIMAAIIAFSTGSSWGTMAILYPLALPSTWIICQEAGMTEAASLEIFYHSIAVVLAGSVLGDHCSPISDTTILSSLASQCDHMSHVRTQLPYAISVGLVSIFMSGISHYLNLHWTLNFLLGIGLLYGIVKLLGKSIKVEA